MKKFLLIPLVIILIAGLCLTGCGKKAETGGILKVIEGAFPAVIGYPPEFWPTDSIHALPCIERLCEWDEEGNQIPVLAESWEVDPENLTITWYLREGVTFHDGTPWNAEACRWNFQLSLDTGTVPQAASVESLEVFDEYTLRMHLTAFNWMMIEDYGWEMMISPTAFENAGSTDEERIAWARSNSVGTGAFKVVEFQRDVVIKYAKNDNYWREGMPYLDGIECRFIPDTMTAAAMREAGEADIWIDVSAVQNIIDLEEKGFTINWGPGMFWTLLPNSNDPDSPFAIKEVREAVEYAIDRPAIAEMLGSGKYEPLHQMASSLWPGYVEGYDPRPYDADKARELLEDAGYAGGFETTILATDAARDAVAALQSYLGDVGIIVEPDIADLGRYFTAVFFTGWDDLVLTSSGINPDATDLYVHYGPNPMTFRTGNIYKSPEYLALCAEALDPQYKDAFEAMGKIKEAVEQAGEDAMIIPLWRSVNVAVMQTYVHSDYFMIHGVIWTPYDDWMEPH